MDTDAVGLLARFSYVYCYELDGTPLYYGIGSYDIGEHKTSARYDRARDIRVGHVDFYRWCCERFDGIERVTVRIVADCLTRKQAHLLETALIVEAARHHDIFNRATSNCLGVEVEYVSQYSKRRRLLTEEERKESQKRANDNKSKSECGLINLAAAAAYRKTEAGKQRKSLSTLISRHSKTDPERAERLRVKRSKLMTEAEWKATPEGRATVAALTKQIRRNDEKVHGT